MDFKEFVDYCRENGVLEAKCGDMQVSLRYEPKIMDLEGLSDEDTEKEFEETLFHSTTR